jgi:hypothetical protein
LLIAQAVKYKHVTYINVSARPPPGREAQGSAGVFTAVVALKRHPLTHLGIWPLKYLPIGPAIG